MLAYEAEILEECRDRSCVLVMAEGLGLERTIWNGIRECTSKGRLVVLLNFSEEEIEHYEEMACASFHSLKKTHPKVRKQLYARGNAVAVSTSIFLTDLLNETVECGLVGAVFVNHVEELRDGCAEAFAVYLLHRTDKQVQVMGYTERSTTMSFGVTFLEEVISLLDAGTLLLYPRFHTSVQRALSVDTEITELRLRLGKRQKEAQVLLVDVMGSVVNALQISERIEVDKSLVPGAEFGEAVERIGSSAKSRALGREIENIRKLFRLLYCVDFQYFYSAYSAMFEEQLRLGKDATWCSEYAAHLLMNVCGGATGGTAEEPDATETGGPDCAGSTEVPVHEALASSVENGRAGASVQGDGVVDARHDNPKIKTLLGVVKEHRDSSICILSSCQETAAYIKWRILTAGIAISGIECATHKEFRLAKFTFDVVVFMDPSISSIRKVEVYVNEHRKSPVVLLMYFENSVEEELRLSGLREEKASFESLIAKKRRLPLNANRGYEDEEPEVGGEVLVDTREMRSSLPFSIYRSNQNMKVSTLDTGDYVLDGVFCIERKSIADFVSSVNSGRLYVQLRRMESKFRHAILLLEFERGKRMCLSDHFEAKKENIRSSILSKLTAVLVNFPGFKIVWSNADATTARVFRSLQTIRVSSDTHAGADSCVSDAAADQKNPVLYEILLHIEGITEFNVKHAFKHFESLRDLANANIGRLQHVFGIRDGAKIHRFFTGYTFSVVTAALPAMETHAS